MLTWVPHERQKLLSEESRNRFERARKSPSLFDDVRELRGALLDFIADFANWDNSTVREYLDTSRALTQAAHEVLGGAPGTRPLVVDPFAGGGSIPLEALRVGADAFASDLNPVAVLLNKVVLDYIPKYGQHLADEVRKWGEWIKREAEKELGEFYPKDADGATPIAYLWARTIRCEGPGCGAEVPLIRSLWLAKKANRSVAVQLVLNPKAKRVDFRIIVKQRDGWVDQANPKSRIESPNLDGTVKRGSATCPCCGYTTPVARLREQFKTKHGGANDARLLCVVTTSTDEQGRSYRVPTEMDFIAVRSIEKRIKQELAPDESGIPKLPFEQVDRDHHDVNRLPMYGMNTWADVFTNRQLLALLTFQRFVKEGCKSASNLDPWRNRCNPLSKKIFQEQSRGRGWTPIEPLPKYTIHLLLQWFSGQLQWGPSWTPIYTDYYMVTADFDAYCATQRSVERLWLSTFDWTRTSMLNIARMAWFSSDRAIGEYAQDIWKVPFELPNNLLRR